MLLGTPSTLTLILVFNVFGMIISSNYTEAYVVKDFEKKIQLKILPEYCAYMQLGSRSDSPSLKGERYKQLLGKSWDATHHYCWGMDKFYLAFESYSNKARYTNYISSAIQDFDYILERSDSSFILKPEILTKKGLALSFLGRNAESIHVLHSAIKIKPDYVYSYIQLSMLFLKKGAKNKAQKVLELGLEHSPSSPILKQALAKLHIKKKEKK